MPKSLITRSRVERLLKDAEAALESNLPAMRAPATCAALRQTVSLCHDLLNEVGPADPRDEIDALLTAHERVAE